MGLYETLKIIRCLVLDSLSTRHLMKLRKRAYKASFAVYYPNGFYIEDIKDALCLRENIPGKKETKKSARGSSKTKR